MASEWAASFPQWPKRDRRGVYQTRTASPAPVALSTPAHAPMAYVARKVRAHLHVEGHNASNLRGDLLDMIRSDHIAGRDRFILHRILESAFKPSTIAPDGFEVDLASFDRDRDWRYFHGIRHRFIREREARIATLNADLIAARQTRNS